METPPSPLKAKTRLSQSGGGGADVGGRSFFFFNLRRGLGTQRVIVLLPEIDFNIFGHSNFALAMKCPRSSNRVCFPASEQGTGGEEEQFACLGGEILDKHTKTQRWLTCRQLCIL